MSQHSSLPGAHTTCVDIGVSPKKFFYLTKVTYNEPKHEVFVEFSNAGEKFVKRFPFFPFTLFSSAIQKNKLESLLVSAGFRGFSLEEEGDLLCLKALSFGELKKISNSLAVLINKKPLVLEPERAFLLHKGWSFFDAFEVAGSEFYRFSPLEKSDGKSSTGLFDLGFFLIKEIPFSEAMRVSEEDALFLVELAAWSSILSVPMEKIPKSAEEKAEFFIENIFFSHGEPLSFGSSERVFLAKGFTPLTFGESLSKIDFSLVWAELFSNNFFNIGPETRNCSCCVPVLLESKNLLPSSLIRVRFLEDNLFFESTSESFAIDFHNSSGLKDARIEKKKEFFLSSFPIGPFSKNDSALVPLMDARRLISQGKAALISSKESTAYQKRFSSGVFVPDSKAVPSPVHELNWFCLNRESFFSKEVRKSNALLFSLRKLMDSNAGGLFSKKDFSHLFFSALFRVLSFSLCKLPVQLTSPSSKFFCTDLAKSIISVQESTLARFKEFSESEGYRVLHANKESAFVKGFSSLRLARDFSRHTRLPQPQIAGFSGRDLRGFS